jgi:hypothetical protein
MEEFKNLKEIIELCKDELENNDENVNATLDFEDLKELQNLINKNKELEKERDGIYTDYQDLGKEKLELEKMVELMAKEMSNEDLNFLFEDNSTIIDYFRKKAKGE